LIPLCESTYRPNRQSSASAQPGHTLRRPVPRRSRSCGFIWASCWPPSAGSRTPAAAPQQPPGAGVKAHLPELGARVLSVRLPSVMVLDRLRALSRPPRPHSSSPAAQRMRLDVRQSCYQKAGHATGGRITVLARCGRSVRSKVLPSDGGAAPDWVPAMREATGGQQSSRASAYDVGAFVLCESGLAQSMVMHVALLW